MKTQQQSNKKILKLGDKIFCKAQQTELTIEQCTTRYVDANAFKNKESSCYNCKQGKAIREEYASSFNKMLSKYDKFFDRLYKHIKIKEKKK